MTPLPIFLHLGLYLRILCISRGFTRSLWVQLDRVRHLPVYLQHCRKPLPSFSSWFSHLPSMSTFNTSENEVSIFFLTGIPGTEHAHIWVSIPICLMYLVAILGNCTILFFIKSEPSLHEPMYYFLSMLALSDLGLSLSSLPTMIRIFLFNAPGISPDACFVQEFFIHGFSAMESSVLLIMSLDRFIAICHPLRYTSILTSARVINIGLAFSLKNVLLILPFPFTLKHLRYCKKSLLSHSYCLHQDVMKLACSDNKVNVIYGLFVAVTGILDFTFIFMSYMMILKAVLRIASQKQRLKVLNTCVSHICAVLIFYVPIISLAVIYRFAKHSPALIRILMADGFLLVPPLMNPIVYCVKSQQIRNRILGKLGQKHNWQGCLTALQTRSEHDTEQAEQLSKDSHHVLTALQYHLSTHYLRLKNQPCKYVGLGFRIRAQT